MEITKVHSRRVRWKVWVNSHGMIHHFTRGTIGITRSMVKVNTYQKKVNNLKVIGTMV